MNKGKARSASIGALLRNLGWMLGGKGFGAVVSLVYIAIATRSLGLEGFGQFALVLGATQAVEIAATFQSWQIIVRYGMPHLAKGRGDALARLIAFTTRLDIVTALVGSVIVSSAMLLLRERFGWTQEFTTQAIIAAVFFNLSSHWTPIGILRLYDRFAAATFADAMTPLVRLAGAVIVALVHPSVIGFLAVWVAAEMMTAIAYWVAASRVKGLSWRLRDRLHWREVGAENPGIGRYAVTTNLGSTLNLGGRQVAVLIVGILATPAAAGIFRLAQQLAQGMGKLSTLMVRALFPELVRSRAYADSSAEFEHLLGRTARITGLGGSLVFVLLLVVGEQTLTLMAGPDFAGAYPVLLLLGTAAALDFATVSFEPALIALGRPGLALRIRIATTATMLALMALLVRPYGGIGAGAAILAASVLAMALFGYSLRRLLARERNQAR